MVKSRTGGGHPYTWTHRNNLPPCMIDPRFIGLNLAYSLPDLQSVPGPAPPRSHLHQQQPPQVSVVWLDWARCGECVVGRPSCFTRACSKHVRYVYTFGCICHEILPSLLPQPLHTSSLAVWQFIHYRERLLSPTGVQQPVQENWEKWVGRGGGSRLGR